MNHREISKIYSELLHKAEYANGRKEVLGLLKKAAKLKSKFEINFQEINRISINVKKIFN